MKTLGPVEAVEELVEYFGSELNAKDNNLYHLIIEEEQFYDYVLLLRVSIQNQNQELEL